MHLTPLARSRTNYDGYLTAVRNALDEAAFEEAWGEGKTMTVDEAVQYAQHEEDTDPATALAMPNLAAGEPTGDLTYREREVALLVVRGLTNRQISEELSISERTAGNHVAKILRKLGLRSRAQIAAHTGAFAAAAETRGGVVPGMGTSDG
jgi:non-specific serine/threonine protein kinase